MPGGLIQLNAYGAQNQYLNGNPQMTFFKSVYRRYTNFSMENIRLELNGPNELSSQNSSILSTKIDRNGDLINKLFFVFNLPDIYSSYYKDPKTTAVDSVNNLGYRFQWVNSIGTTIIKTVSISIGGNTISTLYGEWIKIWHELFSKENKALFDEMTGNIPELFAPEYSVGRNNEYPTSSLDPDHSFDPEIFSSSKYLKNPYLKPPSIRGRKIYVPIPFWFTTNPGLALPLLCLQYHDVHITLELRKLSELYTIINPDLNTSTGGLRIAPDVLIKDHQISNFITGIPSSQFKKPEMGSEENGANFKTENVFGWGFDPHLDVQYVFLDEDERKRFAAVSHEYLIEQVIRQEYLGVVGSSTLDLYLNNPVKALVWMAVRDDFQNSNVYNNYTNWPYEDINVDTVAYIRNTFGEVSYETQTNGEYDIRDILYDKYSNDEISSKFNFNYFDRDIIKDATLLFNGVERFSTRDYIYFNYVQAYQHPLTGVIPGVQMYSFSLEPTLEQPSGACNMSRIKTIQLMLNTINVQHDIYKNDYAHRFNIYVYAINYNIFRVLGGMGNVGYTN